MTRWILFNFGSSLLTSEQLCYVLNALCRALHDSELITLWTAATTKILVVSVVLVDH